MEDLLKTGEIEKFLKETGIDYQTSGNPAVAVDSYKPLHCIEENKITWVKNWSDESEDKLSQLGNLIIICDKIPEKLGEQNYYIICHDPKMCFFEILGEFFKKENISKDQSAQAVICTEKIGKGTSIGEFSYIGENVEVGEDVSIGKNVTITGNVKIGNHTVIGHGSVLGKSGYGYYMAPDGHRKKVPHLGGVIIGNYVEIGANTCIDCGTMQDTVINDYVKINNLCHIAHNVWIGKDVMIAAGVIVCGSCIIEDGVYIAPGAVVKNQIKIGQDAFIGLQTAVTHDVKQEESVFGVPGKKFMRNYQV